MFLKIFLELVLLGFFLNGAEGNLVISPSGNAEVTENSRLSLSASYTGSDSYSLVYWLKNGNVEYTLLATDCSQVGNIPDTTSFEYTCTNGGKDFTLTFKSVSATQHEDKWSCRVNTSPQTDSAEVTIIIKVTTTIPPTTSSSTVASGNPDTGSDLGGIIGGAVSAFAAVFIVVVACFVVRYLKATPGAPKNVKLKESVLTWDEPACFGTKKVIRYEIEYSTDGIKWMDVVEPHNGLETEYRLREAKDARYRVRAINPNGQGCFAEATKTATEKTSNGSTV